MKKYILGLMACSAVLASCDPSVDSVGMPTGSLVDEATLAQGFTYKQYADETYTTEAADGNYFKFFTNPGTIVRVYTIDSEGAESVLSSGVANGSFVLAPARGQNPDQTIYFETYQWDGSKVKASKTVNVHVATELATEMAIICSNSGSKTWKWDTNSPDGQFWGNFGYTADSGEAFANTSAGKWWGISSTEGFSDQQGHRGSDSATGDDNTDAYMVFSEDGKIVSYNKDGKEIRSAKFQIQNYNPENKKVINDQAWSVGQLAIAGGGGILWPYAINTGGYMPEEYEIVRLSADQLILTYAAAGTGSWAEATFWRFVSNSDQAGVIGGYDKSGTNWTWDTEAPDGTFWGNAGYHAGDDFSNETPGKWWGITSTEGFSDQQGHRGSDSVTGDDDTDAYMTFFADGTISSFDAAGTQIRNGKWSIGTATINGQEHTTLNTTAGSILWPYAINTGGGKPEQFELMYLTSTKMALVYAAEGTGDWSECTFWRFKKK